MVTVLALLSGSTIPLTTSAQSDTAPEQPSELSTEAGDTQVRLSWEDPDDSTIDKYQLWQIAQSATLTGANDEFGYSVAVAGDIAVVGMPDDEGSSGDSGAAFVFSKVSGAWSQKYRLKTGDDDGDGVDDAVQDDGFGSSVAFDGATIVVGAPFDDSKRGAAYLFVEPGDGWDNQSGTDTVDLTDPAKLTAPNASVEDEFGYSVAMDGNTVVVGAYSDDSTDTNDNPVSNSGSAYVFTKPGNAWVPTSTAATLTASDAAAGDEFGRSVAVDGNTVVVGASGDDGRSGTEATDFVGSTFVFVKPNSTGWVSTSTAAKLIAETRGNQDYFGRSVAIDGDTIVVGADGQDINTGSAFVFAEPSSGWVNNTETAKLTASDRSSGHRFGFSVALDGGTVVVGAYGEAGSRGSAYAFTKPGTGWASGTETAHLTASDRSGNDRFGSSVAIDGDTVVIGVENDDTAYVFDIVDWEDIAGSNAATTSHIVTGLTNDIDHTFRVRALDSTEASDPSDSVSETPTAASYAPARPVNFSAAQTGVRQVELTWDAHRYPLTVSGYEYNQDGGDWNTITESDSSLHSHTVTGLTAGTTYTFAVRAVNGAGSTESDSRSVTIIGQAAAPDSFTAVAGDEQMWLGWRSPADFTISRYEYQQKTGGDFGDDWTSIPGSRSGTTFHIVTGLTNDTSYTFRVRAVNAAGGSDASVEKPATPGDASAAPGVPEGFAARQTGVGQVELTWVASSTPLDVTGYEFRQNNGSWTNISGSDSRTVSHSFTSLTQGVTYAFRVRAVNNSGNGASSGAESVIVVAEPAAPTDLAAQAGDTQVGLTWKDPGDASIAKYQIFQFPESVIKLISSDRDDGDELGWSVAVDDDTLVIGALGDDDTKNLSGSAYVFTRVAGGWTQAGKLTASDPKVDAGFGHAVAVHGDTIVVGAYEEDHTDNQNITSSNSGAAYVFIKTATGWADMTQTARLTASDAATGDEFGTSVAVHGDTIVVGAPEQSVPADGSAYIFTKPANGWADMTETAALRGQSNGDRFGRSVAVHGDTVAVGAYEGGANDRGEAYVFTKSAATGVWHDKKANDATARLTASDPATNDKFGRAVAMDGDTIVIGAPYHDYDDPNNNTNDVSNSGAAYVFIKTATGGWADTETAKLTASERAENDQFGFSVAVDGNTVVVGADRDDSNRGSAYVFTEPQGGWTDTEGTDPLTAYDRRQNDRFGNFVAVDGDTVLVGAVGDDSAKGSAYVFGAGEWAYIPGSGAGTISHIARGLRNNVKHTFRVRAVNAAGADDASEADAKPVAATFNPSKPADLTVTQTGVGQVLLAWTASTEPLTVRRYQYKQNDGSGFGNWINIEGSDSSTASHTVTGLIAGIEYSFTVGAVNGSGQYASEVESITLEAQAAAPSNLDADAGDEQVKLSWDDPGESTIGNYQLLQIDPSKLTAADGLRGDEFGISVAVDGDTAVIGAYQDDDATNGDNSGSAYVFTEASGVWRQVAKLTADDGAANDEFGYSVAVDGDTIVVGAHQNDADTNNNNNDEGAAYVFTKPPSGWADMTQTAKLTAFGAAAGDEFGISVAVDGNTILVGAHQNDSDDGAAYVFTKPFTGWADSSETAKLIASDAAADDEFGISVALDGDTAVIGARQNDDNGSQSGSAYVFTKVSGVWSQKAKLIASDGAADDEFGISVAVDGDTVVVGARQDDDNGNQSGSAYVFTKLSSGWSNSNETAKLTASDGAANDEFGISVAVEGDTAVIGARQDDTSNDSAYVFTKVSGVWSQKAKLTASDGAADDEFGISVAVDGDTVVVGAYKHNVGEGTGGANAGTAYLMSISEWADIPGSDDETTSHIVTGLTNDVEHTFQVRGVNAAGAGLASARAGGAPTFAIPNRPTGFAADAGDTVVDLSWDDPEDSTIEKYQLLQIIQGGKLTTTSTDDPVVRGDGFGISVAVDGTTAVVGAYKDDDAGADSGSAHVFTRSSSTAPWNWVAKLTASDAAANDEFGISVAIEGDTIVVGAHQNDADDQDNDEGAAYVFTKVSGVWGQKAKLTASDAAANDEFGISVAVHDETVVVGAHLENANDDDQVITDDVNDSGAAYVFIKPGSGGWVTGTETAKLTASDAAEKDQFGISVAVHDDTVVVGAPYNDYDDTDGDTDDDEGAVYVFTKPGSGGWADATETAKLTADNGAANDEFGISVAVRGETVVVGAHKYDVGGGTEKANAGAAYVFIKPTGGPWADGTETAKLIASDATRGDEFGISVAVDDDEDTIVVGAYLDDHTDDDGNTIGSAGSAYVFTQDSNGWSQKTKLTGPSRGKGDWLGYSVAVAGGTVLAGAYRSSISGPDSGAVYLWTVPQWADIANSDATTTSHTVTGLTNRVEYSLQVRAVDKVEGAGAGPASDPLRAMPLKPKPAVPTVLSAVAGDSQVELSWDDPAGGSPPIINYQLWQHAEHPTLTADTRTANDEFGYAVAIDGDTAVVGMPGDDDGNLNAGAAFVFTRDDSSGTWSQVAKLRASDPGTQNTDQYRFGLSVAVHEDTLNGDTIVVGAPDHSNSKGAVYVFSEPSNGWANDTDSDDVDNEFDHTTETAKFLASDGTADDEFGNSVAVVGNTIVVGAYLDDDNGDSSGSAYVFDEPSGGWANDTDSDDADAEFDHTTETLKLSGSSGSDNFGRSVAIDGDTIVVGASGDDSGTGSAFVFIKPATDWANSSGTEVAKLTAYFGSGSDEGDRFGRSVAIDGYTIVVGAYGDDGDTGSAYVFTKPDTGWANSPGTEAAKLTASDASSGDQFGVSIAVDGDTVVIGAHALNEDRPGSAYVFIKAAAGWTDSTEAAKLTGSGTTNRDSFGISVAVDHVAVSEGVYRLTAMVGSNGQGGNDQGAAYLYDIQVWIPIAGSTGETRSHFATGLTNDAEHTFAVRAVNDDGASGPSNQVSEEPKSADSAPAKPRYFSAVQVGAGEVRLEWEPSADPLTIVRFKYTDNAGENEIWKEATGSHSTTVSYTVSDLVVDTTYTFAVRAVNSAGEGVSSDPWSVTIAAAPDRPTALTADAGDEQVELSWRYSGGQTSTTGFQYQQKTGGDFGDDWTDITGGTWTTRSHIVTGLTNEIPYIFRVRAVNVVVGSEPSDPVTSTPEAARSRPARPTNFNAEQTGVGQVELTWDTAGRRVTVAGYQYTADGGSNWSDISGSDSGTNSHTVSGLMVGTTYRFVVRAVNSGMLPGFPSSFRDVTIVDAPRRLTGLGATGGDTQATVQWSVPSGEDDPPIDKYQLLQLAQSKLTADDRAKDDEFAYSVAIDGNTAVVGAPGSNSNAGAVYVFVFTEADGAWGQAAKLAASVPVTGDKFGIPVAIDGNTIAVGAPGSNSNAGAVYVFTEADGMWSQAATLTAADGAANDEFGISVAVDGGSVVVGASGSNSNTGVVYVFTKPDTNDGWKDWDDPNEVDKTEFTAKLTASDGAASDEFGTSVAIDVDTVVVGAHKHDANSTSDAGAAYVFTKPSKGWTDNTEGAKFTAPDGAANDEFGISVAIDVDSVVVGAHKHDTNSTSDAGAAYVFTRNSNSGKWGQPVKLTASNGDMGDGFGKSVAVDGNTAVVGAYLNERDDGIAPGSGSAYVFARTLGVWSQTFNLAAPEREDNDWFGHSVAIGDDGTLLAGVPQDDDRRGSAYAINISNAKWVDFVSTELTMSDDDQYYVYRVRNLTNDQQYAFRVRSVNAAAKPLSAETVAAMPMSAKPSKTEGLSAQPGDSQVTLSWDDPRDSSLTGYQVLQPTGQTKLTAGSDGAANEEFGESVAVDDGTAVVGAPEHDINSNANAGAAYVFTKAADSGEWSGPIELSAGSDGAANDWFGYSVAVDGDGDTIVVGAYQHDVTPSGGGTKVDEAGAAYVFTRDPLTGVWSEPVKLIASDGAANDSFGYSVAVDGDTVVVGARGNENRTGAVYVFTKVGGVWGNSPVSGNHRVQTVKLTASGGGAVDYFGHSVAVDGETIVVGARGFGGSPGAAYVFTKVSGGWGQRAKLTASNADDNDQFGQSVAVDGATVVVGAGQDDETRGSAYVFTKPAGENWADNTETARLAASDRGASDSFGASVAIRGGTIVVGAYYANIDECDPDESDCDDDPRSGAAYLFTKPAIDDWANDPNKDYRTESGKLTLPTEEGAVEKYDEFGNSVALDGQSIVVGAPEGNNGFGSVYVSDIPQWAFLASGAETTSATVGGLTNGVEYTFQVRAVDFYGGGPPSDIVRATPMPAPAAPTNFTATPGNGRVRLTWDDPYDPDITGYEYRQAWGGGNFSPATEISGSSATTTSHTVRDLTNHLTYGFQIRAVNYYGAGDWSPSSNATPWAPNRAPYFIIGSDSAAFTVDENTPPGTPVGRAFAATDPDGDRLTYSLSGTDASSFDIDSRTYQLTVKDPLDYETKSVYQLSVRVNDNRNVGDEVDVTVTVNNVDEAGTVAVSLEQPQAGTALAASLSDPDGSLSNISWQWARSSDGSDWRDISGANSDSYTPVADDVGIYLQATASYTDGHGPGKSAHVVMERQTAQRAPSFEGDVTLLPVDENTPPGTLVGDAITATDPDGDVLTYSLSGTEASSFVLDGSTGQITVGSGSMLDYESGPTRYTVVVSVHDGRDAYGNDDSTIDDRIEVNIDVNNVDEAGTVSVSPEQPESGTALTASLTDPDGSLSDISWQWAASSDGSNWRDISGANSDSYTPVADDVGIYLQATASYTDGHGPGKSAHVVMERQTAQRDPSFEGDVTLLPVDENTPPGTLVGDAITATDPDGDVLTYSLSGTEASSFVLDGSTGQITVGSGSMLDYESGPTRYTVVVSVHDGRDAYGNDDSTIDDLIEVSIDVSNVDEAGTVSVSSDRPKVGAALAASLSDPDGSLSDISWQWAASSGRANWQDTAGASSSTYTPVDLDADKYLRVTASYADGEGSGKQAQAVLSNPVQGLPEPVATPTPAPIVPVDDGGISLWWIILMAAGAVAGAAVIYIIVRKRGRI